MRQRLDNQRTRRTYADHHPVCASKARNKGVKLALIFRRVFLYDIATKFLGTSATRKTHVLLVPEAHVSLPSGHY
jgi:hypothetical protein